MATTGGDTTDRPIDRDDGDEETEGGDPACWSGLVCPECGGVAGDGSGHRGGCPAAEADH